MNNKKYTVNYRTLMIGISDLTKDSPRGFGYFDTLKKASKYAKSEANKRIQEETQLDYVI